MRGNLRESNWKSKPLHERKRLLKPIKPQYPLVKGTIKCPECKQVNKVEANSEVVNEWPLRKAWLPSAYCKAKVKRTFRMGELSVGGQPVTVDREVECGALLTGWIVVDEQ